MGTKKLTALITAGILAVCAVPMGAGADILKGDINQDGIVDSKDGDLLLDFIHNRYYAKEDIPEEEIQHYLTYGDMDGDGNVYFDDVILLGEVNSDITVNTQMGDVNHDGYIDAIDSTAVMYYYAALSIDNYDDYTAEEHENFRKYGDLSGDGTIDAIDSTFILIQYAENATLFAE